MRIMIFDTETQSLPLWGVPSDDPRQPHIVQLTSAVYDADSRSELEFESSIVMPAGWIIPDEAANIHKITTEMAMVDGKPEAEVVDIWLRHARNVDLVCAFGIDFDMRILRIALRRHGASKEVCDELKRTLKTHCVMRQATPLAKIPPTDKMMRAGRKTWKTPTLSEAVQAILGWELDGAHDSRVDVLATAKLYFHMNKVTA